MSAQSCLKGTLCDFGVCPPSVVGEPIFRGCSFIMSLVPNLTTEQIAPVITPRWSQLCLPMCLHSQALAAVRRRARLATGIPYR